MSVRTLTHTDTRLPSSLSACSDSGSCYLIKCTVLTLHAHAVLSTGCPDETVWPADMQVWTLQEGLTKQRAQERQALDRFVADASAT